ncbi:hypothetical protein [Flavobacterium selenitireducens]|uniref:hypothetical protein n=1 Tax=Flavobacterium selenitireducens TaxID=2722704 RepID=UPI00168BEAB3|nr:hypothetical protein [Flavobacterium selenitireducens]MBD3581456.1 hypothetical protein [Flavobacterium selenitireducens]
MKKITLFLFMACLPLISCSSDDSSDGQSTRKIKATIDGTPYTFNTVSVGTQEFTDNGFTYTDVTITGSIDNDPSKTISIIMMQGETGNDASWYFGLQEGEREFQKNGSFSTVVSESTNNFVKGTFSGTVVATDDGETKVITDGSFEATY